MQATFPATSPDDAEDVAWALSTGAALFKRGDLKEAAVWLQRAAEAATALASGSRATELADAAAALAEAAAGQPSHPPPPPPPRMSGPPPPPKVSRPPPPPVLPKPAAFAPPAPEPAAPLPDVKSDVEPANEPTGRRIDPSPPQQPASDAGRAEGPAISLAMLRPLAELSEAVQSGLAQSAVVESLAADEEAIVAGLALVTKGDVTVSATIADVPAATMTAGDVIYAKGSIAESVSLRLVAGAPGAAVALWDPRASDEALCTSPALLERLKSASTRIQALAGATLGPFGDRLDDSLRAMVLDRLELRVLSPGDVVGQAGEPVAGMIVLGIGTIEIEIDGEVRERLGPGDVVFGSEVLGGGTAPATAAAGPKGAVVLFGERRLVHELGVTCPPLLEVFSET